MSQHSLLNASSQVALAALLYDIPYIAQHAQVDPALTNIAPVNPWQLADTDETVLRQIVRLAYHAALGFQPTITTAEPVLSEATSQIRLSSLLEQIRLVPHTPSAETRYVYPLQALSINSLFPQLKTAKQAESASHDYAKLWQTFRTGLDKIPNAHRANLPLWLDHFDSLWQIVTHAIPLTAISPLAAHSKADVSVYDHSKTTAALAVALWRYHQTYPSNLLPEEWHQHKFLLIQGDFFGIQDFIFASGGETRKYAAKLLRGRSFYVSLLMECAALKVMEALGLPSTSQIINAAGKFLIVASNTEETKAKLKIVQQELNQWFLQHSLGQAGIGLAWLGASCNDFTQTHFSHLMKALFEQLEKTKLQRFDLCSANAPVLFGDFLDQFNNDKGVCAIDGRSAASVKLDNKWVSPLAADQIKVGHNLTHYQRLLLTRSSLEHNTLGLAIFGYYVNFSKSEDISGKFGALARTGELLRVIDFSLAQSADEPSWHGYARRAINTWIPRFTTNDFDSFDKYTDTDEIYDKTINEAKTLNHLADEDKRMDASGNWLGVSALMTLKGDVDNLGIIFQQGLGENQANFAKMAGLSRQINAFFSIYLPYLCQNDPTFHNIYTVFAGGDDFFLIGPWHSTLKLAQTMRDKFTEYVAHNPDVHFSAGLAITKAGLPINYLAEMAETALEQAKTHNPQQQTMPPKNAVTCFGHSVAWLEFNQLLDKAQQLNELRQDFSLSTSYLYRLLDLVNLREGLANNPANAIWFSRFQYQTYRMLETWRREGRKLEQAERQRLQKELSLRIASQGIDTHKGNYRIALFTHIYENRR